MSSELLNSIRLEKQREYKIKVWLPYFYDKYSKLLDKKQLARNKIAKILILKILPEVINPEVMDDIPGIFRYRVLITDENLKKPVAQKKEKPIVRHNPVRYSRNTADLYRHEIQSNDRYFRDNIRDHVPMRSRGLRFNPPLDDEFHNQNDNYLNMPNRQTFGMNYDDYSSDYSVDFKDDDYDAIYDVMESSLQTVKNDNDIDRDNAEYDEMLVNQAILQSLEINTDNISNQIISENKKNVSVPTKIKKKDPNMFHLYVCIDLRNYSHDFHQAIHVYDKLYYLTNDQISHAMKIWNKVNPETTAGIRFKQDLEYNKSLAKDINK